MALVLSGPRGENYLQCMLLVVEGRRLNDIYRGGCHLTTGVCVLVFIRGDTKHTVDY